MATLKVRFKLDPGREGVVLSKLSQQTARIEAFLRSLGSDLGEQDRPNLWIAKNFRDGSFISTIEYQHVVEAEQAVKFKDALESFNHYKDDPKKFRRIPSFVSAGTISKFAAIRHGLDPGEKLGLAIFNLETGRQGRWDFIDKLQLEYIESSIETEVRYVGSVMGTTYEWNKGAREPYIVIRELNTNELVKCFYSDVDYHRVSNLFSDKTAVVIVEGQATYNRITEKTEIAMAHSFDFAPSFSDEDFKKFFGFAPNLTGDLSTDQVIAEGRDDGE